MVIRVRESIALGAEGENLGHASNAAGLMVYANRS